MDLVEMNVSDIIPYSNNPRINDDAVEAVKESIKQCEYVAPIIVDENNVILAGHTRLKALKELGYTSIQVCVKNGLTDEQKRKYRLLDNKTAEIADWDFDRLDNELGDLNFGDFDFGFDVINLDDGNYGNREVSIAEFSDDKFEHECPKCGFKFNDGK